MATIDELVQDAIRRMDAAIEHTRNEFNTVRTGRASAALLDRITVDYYGTPTPLKQLATINVPEPRMLTIQPFDPQSVRSIERAIQESELGLTPSNDGKLIRLPIPQLTEERRKELVRVVRHMAEEGRAGGNARLDLWIAFDYGGRAELVEAARRIAGDGVGADQIDERLFASYL